MRFSAIAKLLPAILTSILTLGISAQPAALSPEPSVSSEVVDLPAFNVSADRVLAPLQKWRYVSIPGYEILSNDNESNTRRFIQNFYLLQQVGQLLFPGLEETNPLPTYVVICVKGNAFEQFIPPQFREANDVAEEINQIGSLFVRDEERSALIVDYLGASGFENFQRSYFKNLFSRASANKLPPWFEEGMLGILAALEFDQHSVTIGKVAGQTTRGFTGGQQPMTIPGYAGRSLNDSEVVAFSGLGSSGLVHALNNQRLIPFKDFFQLDPNTPEGLEAIKKHGGLGVYQAQAAAFAHLCLYSWGAKSKYTPNFYKLIEKASAGPVTEEVFKSCFNRSFKQIGLTLRGHIQMCAQQYVELTAPKGKGFEAAPKFEVKTATDSDSSRIAGETLRLSGQSHNRSTA
ncbi:MAG: hypothetical protein QM760_13235 [Nibricoccus sp.]